MVAIYCDGAALKDMNKYAKDERIAGFTTNPSLMKKAGIANYREFAKQVLDAVDSKPVSFEVLADDWKTMEEQALEIASWGKNVWVKIPITNSKGRTSTALIQKLSGKINMNCTAVMTPEQCSSAMDFLVGTDILSIFVGRIADTGISHIQALAPALAYKKYTGPRANILWASPREILNYYQAAELGVDIITLSPELIAKLALRGKDLEEYSLETVKQFHEDGKEIVF